MREGRKNINEKKRLLKNSDISVKNNSLYTVILKSERNGESFYTLGRNEVEDITFEDLQSIIKKQKSLFEDFTIIIDDVYSFENDELTIEDVEMVLGLSKIRKGVDENPDEYYFDDLLLGSSFDEFKNEVSSMKIEIVNRLIERAVALYKDREFSDGFKINLLEKRLGLENVFEDVEASLKEIKSDIEEM